jgi:hypothetical protein
LVIDHRCVIEGRSQGEVVRACGVSQGWVSRLVARYRVEAEEAFETAVAAAAQVAGCDTASHRAADRRPAY